MEIVTIVTGLFITLAFYTLLFWLFFRAIRAIERIADNLWAISRANTRLADATEKIADKVERIANNENTRK